MITRILAITCAAAGLAIAQAPPQTTKVPVTDQYHGQSVVDDYRWLEDWSDAKVKAWSEAQNTHARGVLDALPQADALRPRITQLFSASGVSYGSPHWAGKQLYTIKRQPPKQQPFIVAMPSPFHPDQERIVVDPNAIDPEGGTSIDWFVPSPDGSLLAVSLSSGGSEAGDIHVFDAATGKRVHEIVHRVNGGTAGGSVAWAPDGKGFYYTRYPREGERPAEDLAFYVHVHFHRLGDDPAKDRYEVGKEFPRIAEIMLEVLHDGPAAGAVLASVQKGDGGEYMHFTRASDGAWTQVTRYEDRIVQAAFTPDGQLLLISRKNAPRGMLQLLPLGSPLASARTIVPEGKDVIVNEFLEPTGLLLVTPQTIYVTYQLGGPCEVRAFAYDGTPQASPKLMPVSAPFGLTQMDKGEILVGNVSYVSPTAWGVFDPAKGGEPVRTPISSAFPFSFADFEVVREFATSKDGTKVPLNIIRRKGLALDGSHPCLITGYGGYGVSLEPAFRGGLLALLEQGFVWAEVNLRGGGEYGDQWHRQGNLLNKQNVFDDMASAVKHMHTAGYTTPQRTAIQGGSNGGLLMGAVLTQHPNLVKCVVSSVGIYDMLRVELSSNGEFNIPEFGSVKDTAQFRAMFAYSPYHNVRADASYPSVLFLTGANDPRVDPMQSRKMTARLQSVGANVLLRTSSNSGHGSGTALNERIEQAVDVYAFLCDQLGVKLGAGAGR